jgi:hypothetical protein
LEDDMNLLARLEIGKELLRKKGQKVTNVKALEAAYAEYFAAAPGQRATPREIRELAEAHAKRIPTARKRVLAYSHGRSNN